MSENKKIMFVISSLARGGAEKVVSILAGRFARYGWNVSILVLFKRIDGYAIDPKVRLIDRTNSKIPSRLRFFDCILKERKIIKEEKPDIVISFLSSICLISGFATTGLDTKLICCERNDPSKEHTFFLFNLIINHIYSKCYKTVLQTKRAYDYFPKSVQINSIIIPNPVHVETYATRTSKKIVTAGRLNHQKNQALLINAFYNVHKNHPDYELYIYGDGELKEALTKQISSLNLESSVFLKGNSNNLHNEISDCSIFVLSSDFEGLSNALIEAMIMGLFCITTDCAGSDDIISNGENGLIVPVGDMNALIKAIEFAIENPDKACEMAQKAKLIAEKFELEDVISKWKKVVEN